MKMRKSGGWAGIFAAALLVAGLAACETPSAVEPASLAASQDGTRSFEGSVDTGEVSSGDTLRTVDEPVATDTAVAGAANAQIWPGPPSGHWRPTIVREGGAIDVVASGTEYVYRVPVGSLVLGPYPEVDPVTGKLYLHYKIYLPNGDLIHLIWDETENWTKVFTKSRAEMERSKATG